MTEPGNGAGVTATKSPTDAPLAAAHARRSLFGRLYHGETAVDFYGRRRVGLLASGVLLVVTLVSLLFQGLNLGIDFQGGVAWEVPSEEMTVEDAEAVLEAEGLDPSSAKIQTLTSDSGRRLRVQVTDQPVDVVQRVQLAFAEAAGVELGDVSSVSVSASWGRSITEKAIRALVVFLVLVMLYISWRLQWRMAVGAIAAVVHDVVVSVGVYSLLGFEVTPATVVSFLTILGFSLYDTIVVFDKMNENTERFSGSRLGAADVMNVSMNQVLARSINTSIAAVLPVLSLLVVGAWILGVGTLEEFALALFIGLAIGSYSSLFVAAPLYTMMRVRATRGVATRSVHVTGAELERLVIGGSPEGHRRELMRARQAVEGVDPGTVVAARDAATVLTHAPRPRKKKRR